jgi:phage baseplate assembly protein gpV
VGMKLMRVAGCAAFCLTGAAAQGAILNALAGAEWHVAENWNPAGVPTSVDGAQVNYDRTLTHSTGTHTINTLRLATIGTLAQIGNFNMTGGNLSVNFDFSTGYAGTAGAIGKATLSGGAINAKDVTLGHYDADAAGEMTISGGTLNWTQALRVGTLASGTLKIDGTNAVISGANVFLEGNSTLRFDLGANSVSAVGGNNLTINSAANLIIDGSSYTGGPAVIDLVKFKTRSGAFDAGRITIQNFKGLTGSIDYDGDSMYLRLISEPIILGSSSGACEGSVI